MFYYLHVHIVICNQAIKKFRFLPTSCLRLPPNEVPDLDAIATYTNAVGFDYDSKAKNYKIVRIVEFSGKSISHYN